MATDIIADSQTQRTIDSLMRGDADEKSMQVAIASLLIAMTRQGEELQAMKSKLWSKDDVEKYVDSRHSFHCNNCPARKYVDSLTTVPSAPKKERPWYLEVLLSESFRYFLLVVILVWAVIVMRTTTEETSRIAENAQRTIGVNIK